MMLKQGVKRWIYSDTCIIPTFVCQSYATSFPGLLLSFTLISKSKKTRLDLTLSFKTSVDARVEGLVSNLDYLENWCRNFIQKKCGRKRRLLSKKKEILVALVGRQFECVNQEIIMDLFSSTVKPRCCGHPLQRVHSSNPPPLWRGGGVRLFQNWWKWGGVIWKWGVPRDAA